MTASPGAVRYRWSELACDRPMSLLERRRVIGQHMMISQVILKKGCLVPTHAHANEQFCCVMRGRLRFLIGAQGDPSRKDAVLESGDVLHLPSNVPHSAEAIEETLVLDMFSPPSEKTGIDQPAAERR